jgi:mRNA interferase RelE/StbE
VRDLEITDSAKRFLLGMSEPDLSRVVEGIAGLRYMPPRGDIVKMSGGKNEHRLRIGKYRVLFRIEDNMVTVKTIGTRGQIYKR